MIPSSEVLGPVERFRIVLETLAQENLGTRDLVIADPNGLPIASLRRGPNTVSATASATMIVAAARSVAGNLGLRGEPDVLIEGEGWKVIVWSLGDGFSICGVFDADVNLALVRLSMQERTTELRELIREFQ